MPVVSPPSLTQTANGQDLYIPNVGTNASPVIEGPLEVNGALAVTGAVSTPTVSIGTPAVNLTSTGGFLFTPGGLTVGGGLISTLPISAPAILLGSPAATLTASGGTLFAPNDVSVGGRVLTNGLSVAPKTGMGLLTSPQSIICPPGGVTFQVNGNKLFFQVSGNDLGVVTRQITFVCDPALVSTGIVSASFITGGPGGVASTTSGQDFSNNNYGITAIIAGGGAWFIQGWVAWA